MPVFAERLGPANVPVDVVAYRLDVDADAVAAAAALLREDEQQRAYRFLHDRDRRRFTVARANLRLLLSERLGIPGAMVGIQYGANGKPALSAEHERPALRFNLSHADELAVFAFAEGHEVGIDIERIDRRVDAERLTAGFFSPQEIAALRALAPDQRRLGFLNGWTRKEAFVKALGSGLDCPLNAFDVAITSGDSARILRLDPAYGDPANWHMESFSPAPEFVAALVVETPSR